MERGDPAYDEATFIGNELYADRRPAYVVMAHSVADVAAAMQWAKAHDVPFSVKSGGHSYAGYCLNRGGVMVDLSPMQEVVVDTESMTVRVGGGARWLHVYEELAAVNRNFMVMGGICPTVGVGGATLGGGINLFSRSFGLTIDTLVAMTIMTASGDVVDLSASDELDDDLRELWWAVRGGGGGNFGIVLSMTLRIFEMGPIAIGSLSWDDLGTFEEALAVVNSGLPREVAVDAVWVKPDADAPTTGSMTVSGLGSVAQCQTALGEIFSPRLAPSRSTLSPQVFVEWDEADKVWDPFTHGTFFYHVGFIFGPGRITPDLLTAVRELMDGAPSKSVFHWNHVGAACTEIPADATAYRWRDGEYVATAKIYWHDETDTATCMDWAQRVKDRLTPYAIDGRASYINYIENPFEGWQEAYYGANYERLRDVKSMIDPEGFFTFPLSIEPREVAR